jgi:tetratricopeptide (TPR) repeat protein
MSAKILSAKIFPVLFAVASVSTIGLATLLPVDQAPAQTPSMAAQPVQDSDFFLKRATQNIKVGMSQQERQAVLNDFQQAIKLNPKNAAAYTQRGTLLWDENRKAAMLDFDRAVEVAPKDLVVRGYRATFRELNGDNQGAIADLSYALKLAPEESEARYLRAIILKRDTVKDYKAALTDLDYLIDKDQTLQHRSDAFRVSRYQMRAEVREKMGDKAGAIADLKIVESGKAIELESTQLMQKALETELAEVRARLQRLQDGK